MERRGPQQDKDARPDQKPSPVQGDEEDDVGGRHATTAMIADGDDNASGVKMIRSVPLTSTTDIGESDSAAATTAAAPPPPPLDANIAVSGGAFVSTADRSPDDVLCGRGIPFQKWSGNQRMRRIVQQYRQEYASSKRHEKGLIVQRVIQEIKQGGARFLHPVEMATGATKEVEQWVEANNDYVYEKVSHAMRQKKKRSESSLPQVGGSGGIAVDSPSLKKQRVGRTMNETTSSASSSSPRKGATKAIAPDTATAVGSRSILESNLPPSNALAGLGGVLPTIPLRGELLPASGSGSNPASLLGMSSSASLALSQQQQQQHALASSFLPSLPNDTIQRLLQAEQLRQAQEQQRWNDAVQSTLQLERMRRDDLLLQLQIKELQKRNATELQASRIRSLLQLNPTSPGPNNQQQLQLLQQQLLALDSNPSAAAMVASASANPPAFALSGLGPSSSSTDVETLQQLILEAAAGAGGGTGGTGVSSATGNQPAGPLVSSLASADRYSQLRSNLGISSTGGIGSLGLNDVNTILSSVRSNIAPGSLSRQQTGDTLPSSTATAAAAAAATDTPGGPSSSSGVQDSTGAGVSAAAASGQSTVTKQQQELMKILKSSGNQRGA